MDTTVVAESPGKVSEAKTMRVLVPDGALCVKDGEKWTIIRKVRPDNIDEWSHFLHGPDNNPVANDTVAGPPPLLHAGVIKTRGGPGFRRPGDTRRATFYYVNRGIRYLLWAVNRGLRGDAETYGFNTNEGIL
jgi:hypothetical protein